MQKKAVVDEGEGTSTYLYHWTCTHDALIKDACTDACPMYTYTLACVQQLILYLGLGKSNEIPISLDVYS